MTTRGPAELARIKLRHPLWAFRHDADGLAAARDNVILRGARLADLETPLAACEHPRSRPGALAREFPDWQIDIHPAGVAVCTAYWSSPDGRSRRYIVARSCAELLARLRAIASPGRPS
jgi:hypothetical protein